MVGRDPCHNPREGILNCIRHALDRLGEPCPTDREFERYIGPPLQDSFGVLFGVGSPRVAEAIALYRERFSTLGILENKVYPGIPGVAAIGALWGYGSRKELLDAGAMVVCERPDQLCEVLSSNGGCGNQAPA